MMATKIDRLKVIRSEADAPIVGVAITITSHRNTHCGILYRDADDRVLLLHLRFHLNLASEALNNSYMCADPELEVEDAEAVAGHCRLIAKDQPPIWFAIHHNRLASFGLVRGKIALLKEGKGLNCSTFVMAVFQRAGPGLVDFTNWPKRDSDKAWQRQLVNMLQGVGIRVGTGNEWPKTLAVLVSDPKRWREPVWKRSCLHLLFNVSQTA